MSSIDLKSVMVKDDKISIEWSHDLDGILTIGVTLDDDGSCTTTYLPNAGTHADIEKPASGSYEVSILAKTVSGPVRSNTLLAEV